jgi:hypothetical protein
MTDPQRLKDEHAGDLEGQLLRSVASDAPRRDAHQRTLVALGLGGAALGLQATTTAAAATKMGTALTVAVIAKYVGIGVGAAVVAAGATYAVPRLVSHERSTVVAAGAHSPAPVVTEDRLQPPAIAQDQALPGRESAPKQEAHQLEAPNTGNAAPPAARAARSNPPAVKDTATDSTPAPKHIEAPEAPGLADEVAALDAARQKVSSDPAGTLRLLDDYQSRFPHGDLAPEALVLRIEALVRSGQRGAADKLASDYLARNPGSPHARKIRTLLGEGASSTP